MKPTFHFARATLLVAALVAVVVSSSSCAGAVRDVQIPGAMPPEATTNELVERREDELFTRQTSTVETPGTTSTTTTAALVSTTTVAPTPRRLEVGVPSAVVVPAVTGWAAFDLHLMTLLEAGSPAVSATVMRDGDVVHEVAVGERTEAGDSVEIGDRYRVASISKVITAITTLRLVEQGLIGLDEPVGVRLAGRVGVAPAAGVEQITVRHLLTHRSGLAQYENLMFRRQVESCGAAGATGLASNLERSPGSTLRYSNLNFCLLGLLIEDVSGRSYEDVVRSELLAPLEIDGMRLAGTFDVQDGDVEHRSDEGRNYMEVLGAAGSWIASPTEVVTIVNALDLSTPGWKPLSPASVAQMQTITQDPPPPPLTPEQAATTSSTLEPSPPPTPPTSGYGMGLMIFGPETFGHTGTLESTHAMTARQADGLTWAITVSGDHPSSSRDLADVIGEAFRYASVG